MTDVARGELAEWSKAHDWKSCDGLYPSLGSNPKLSAMWFLAGGCAYTLRLLVYLPVIIADGHLAVKG